MLNLSSKLIVPSMKGYGLLSYSYGIYQKLNKKPTSDNPLIAYVTEGLELAPVILHIFKLDNVRMTAADDIAVANPSPTEDEKLRALTWLSRFPMLKSAIDTGSPLVNNFVYKDGDKKIKDFGINLTKSGNTFDITLVTNNPIIDYYMNRLSMESQIQFLNNFVLNKISNSQKSNKKTTVVLDVFRDTIQFLMTKSIIPNVILDNPTKRKAFMDAFLNQLNTISKNTPKDKDTLAIINKTTDILQPVFYKTISFNNLKTFFKILIELNIQIEGAGQIEKKQDVSLTLLNVLFDQLYTIAQFCIQTAMNALVDNPNTLLLRMFTQDEQSISIATDYLQGTKTEDDFNLLFIKKPNEPISYTTLKQIKLSIPKDVNEHTFFYNNLSVLKSISVETTPFFYNNSTLDNINIPTFVYKDETAPSLDATTIQGELITNSSLTALFFLISPALFTSIETEMCGSFSEDISSICISPTLVDAFSELKTDEPNFNNIIENVFSAIKQQELSVMSTTSKVIASIAVSSFLAYGAYNIIKNNKKTF